MIFTGASTGNTANGIPDATSIDPGIGTEVNAFHWDSVYTKQ